MWLPQWDHNCSDSCNDPFARGDKFTDKVLVKDINCAIRPSNSDNLIPECYKNMSKWVIYHGQY